MTDEQKARELREKIAREFYIALNMNRTGFAREYFEYEYPRLPKEPQYEKQDPINSLPYYYEFADSILSLILKEVEGARLTDDELIQVAIDSLPKSGGMVREVDNEWLKIVCNAQLEAVKKILGKV
jgi:hypothetical protein